jgi:signal transduction histidine kinase
VSPRTAARIAWAAAALSAAMGIGGLAPSQLAGLGTSTRSPIFLIAFVLSLSVIGALVVSRQPKNVFGWILTMVAVLINFNLAGSAYAQFAVINQHGAWPAGVAIAWLAGGWNWILISAILLIFIPLLYPTGRLLSPRWRFAAWCAVAFMVLAGIPNALMPGPLFGSTIRNPVGLEGFAGLLEGVRTLSLIPAAIGVVGAVASLVVRFRRARGQERQQLKWFLYGCIVFMIPLLVRGPVPDQIQQLLTILLWPALPISIAIAMLKYRLYDIDLVIHKSLVYGALAVFITAVYVGIVVGIGAAIGSGGRPNLLLSIVATAVVAVAFQPVREWVQRVANRLVYGRRATPYEVMAEFSQGMATVPSTEELLPRMAEAAGRGVSARQARVTIFLETESQAVTWPAGATPPTQFDRVVPIVFAGSSVGEIAVAMPQGAPLRPSDGKLLTDLSAQAGLAMHNVRLTLDLHERIDEITRQAGQLRASRNRIVAAQDTERRRLEQNLDAGVHRELLRLAADLAGIKPLLLADPPDAATRLDGLAEACNQALQELRDLARGIYPPLLRDQGLVAALRAQAAKMAIPIELRAEAVGGDRYSEEVEAAVYFSCVEALREARIGASLTLEPYSEGLRFSVEGADISADRLQDVEDRVESLGGRVDVQRAPGGAISVTGRIPSRQAVNVA